jgi:hypothetical protein
VHIQPQSASGKDAQAAGPVATMADRITIKSADAKLIVERGRIARVAPKEP